MHDFRWPALITLGVLVLLFVLAGAVGKARAKYGIKAPATTGDPVFERTFRAHQNTIENTVMFLPALWLFAAFVGGIWAAALGAVWIACGISWRIRQTPRNEGHRSACPCSCSG
jgi:uncharacterized MAPEG superfamily protein